LVKKKAMQIVSSLLAFKDKQKVYECSSVKTTGMVEERALFCALHHVLVPEPHEPHPTHDIYAEKKVRGRKCVGTKVAPSPRGVIPN
jgi:hypothetical protein